MSDDPRHPSLADQLEQFSTPQFTPFDAETGTGLERVDAPTGYQTQIADGEYAAPSQRSQHEYGVLFRADHETLGDGMCRQARLHARALAAHMPVLLASIHSRVRRDGLQFGNAGDDMLEQIVFDEVGMLRRTQIRNYLAVVYHTQIHSADGLKSLLLPEHTRTVIGADERLLARSIVYVPWERSTVAPEAIEMLNRVGQVWLQCTRNRAVFEKAGLEPERVRLIYPAYDPHGPVAAIPAESPTVPRGKRFYNIGKWEPRKAQHRLAGAFLMAYRPDDHASLTIKTTYFGKWNDYPGFAETLPYWLAQESVRSRGWTAENVERRVHIYDGSFSDEQMTQLHRLHNIYVSAAHAEGWDYPAFDATTAGNALVHVGFGGSEDYTEAERDLRVSFREGPVHPDYQWEAEATWAEYDMSELVRVLTEATAPARRYCVGFGKRFGMKAAGNAMVEHLVELLKAEAPEELEAAQASWRNDDVG